MIFIFFFAPANMIVPGTLLPMRVQTLAKTNQQLRNFWLTYSIYQKTPVSIILYNCYSTFYSTIIRYFSAQVVHGLYVGPH